MALAFSALGRKKGMKHFLRTILTTGFASAALVFSGCADANSEEQKIAPETASVVSTATLWDIQPETSHIRFSALQEGEAFSGEFESFSGIIRFDPETPETGQVDIEVALGSVEAGSTDRNSTLPGKLWFSTKAFPTAVFTSSDISKSGNGFLARGQLTLKGATVPLDLPFNLTLENDRAVMTGRVEMDRTAWKVGSEPWDTDEWVSRNVSLDIQVEANRVD